MTIQAFSSDPGALGFLAGAAGAAAEANPFRDEPARARWEHARRNGRAAIDTRDAGAAGQPG